MNTLKPNMQSYITNVDNWLLVQICVIFFQQNEINAEVTKYL